jgi:hypothetical protein
MRRTLQFSALCLALAAAACQEALSVSVPSTPKNLSYELEPSGDSVPRGILLVWDYVADADLPSYRVYSRGSSSGSFGLRGETTSNTFHDNGVPHLEYFVTAVDLNGNESDASNVITVDERLRLVRPGWLFSISLNGAIHLQWDDTSYVADPARFQGYRIYSTPYDLDAGVCDPTWFLEGTTVAPEFLASALPNGSPRCFGVTAVSREGYESMWSPLRQDTPRPDARNVLVYALQQDATKAGFRFWNDANSNGKGEASELGLVESGNATDIDFRVTRGVGDTLWIEPRYSGDSMQVYGQVADLTSIDYAPEFGYTRNLYQAVPTYGYVFQMVDASGLHYGALRVTHVNRDYMIFDWSMQTDIGNPELIRRAGLTTALPTGFQVPGSQ